MIFHVLYLQEQTTEDVVMLNGFGTIVNSLSKRVKPYLPQICGTILWRLNNKSAKVRQQAADLISRIAVVMKTCQEEKLMGHLGVRFNIISGPSGGCILKNPPSLLRNQIIVPQSAGYLHFIYFLPDSAEKPEQFLKCLWENRRCKKQKIK